MLKWYSKQQNVCMYVCIECKMWFQTAKYLIKWHFKHVKLQCEVLPRNNVSICGMDYLRVDKFISQYFWKKQSLETKKGTCSYLFKNLPKNTKI
jgi:hypothetical protein